MARKPREKSTSGIYHIMLRGINKQVIFEDSQDRYIFLSSLKTNKKTNYYLYAYCLMDNHVHLLMQEADSSVSTSINKIASGYAQWYNKKYERCGSLFQDRFKSENIENDSYFLTALRYIHQNPVKAGMPGHIHDLEWTSYREYITKPVLIDTDLALRMFSENEDRAKEQFAFFSMAENEDECLEDADAYKWTDTAVRKLLAEMGVKDLKDLAKSDKIKRDKILKEIRKIDGISIRQISRLTGISKGIIERL